MSIVAQANAADSAGDQDSRVGSLESRELPSVTVTARRQEENLQAVPVAVTVISSQGLQDNNVQTLADIQYLVPSLTISGSGYKDGLNFSLRGQGSTYGGVGVVVYVNDVPVPTVSVNGTGGGPGLIFDLQDVQVLKGPQGTLFGLNSMGGDVLLRTARPTNEFGGNIQATYGNHDDREINGDVNIPIVSDVLLTRLAITGQWRDGYTHILSTYSHPGGVDTDNRNTWGIRGTVLFRPTDQISNETIATYSQYRSYSSPNILSFVYPGAPAGVAELLAQQQQLGIRTSLPIDVDDISNGTNLMVSNTTQFNIVEGVTFKNILGYSYVSQYLELDQDGTIFPIFDFPLGGGSPPRPAKFGNTRQTTDEVQLLGKMTDLNWVLGAFYLDNPPPAGYILQTANVAGFVDDSQSLFARNATSRALFAQLDYPILPSLKLTLGTRYTKDDIRNVQLGGVAGSVCYGPVQTNCDASTIVDSSSNNHATTWTAALDYQLNKGTLVYFTSRRGYRAGGFNYPAFTGAAAPPGFGPEYVNDFELGSKSDWHVGDVPIRTNADVWYQNYTDIQASVIDPVYASITRNAGTARFWGAEFESRANLTDDLQLGLSYSYVNRRFTHFTAEAIAAGGVDDIKASETLNNPPHKYQIDARYKLPLASELGDASIRANWSWQATGGDRLIPAATIHAYGLLGASADWNNVFGASVDVTLFGSNLLNKDYVYSPMLSFEPGSFGLGTQIWGEPRMYGIRVRYRFGGEAK